MCIVLLVTTNRGPCARVRSRKRMLHIQMDGLIAAVEERSAELWAANSSGETQPGIEDDRGYRIAMVGDSTMRVRKRGTHRKKGETARMAFFVFEGYLEWQLATCISASLGLGGNFWGICYATTYQHTPVGEGVSSGCELGLPMPQSLSPSLPPALGSNLCRAVPPRLAVHRTPTLDPTQHQAAIVVGLLSTRLTDGGIPQCRIGEDFLAARCTGGSPSPSDQERVVISFEFTKAGSVAYLFSGGGNRYAIPDNN